MTRLIAIISCIIVGVAFWRMTEHLSPDAISMALGVLFGTLAGIPMSLLVLAGSRRPSIDESRIRAEIRREVEREFMARLEQRRTQVVPARMVWKVVEND